MLALEQFGVVVGVTPGASLSTVVVVLLTLVMCVVPTTNGPLLIEVNTKLGSGTVSALTSLVGLLTLIMSPTTNGPLLIEVNTKLGSGTVSSLTSLVRGVPTFAFGSVFLTEPTCPVVVFLILLIFVAGILWLICPVFDAGKVAVVTNDECLCFVSRVFFRYLFGSVIMGPCCFLVVIV